MGQLSSINLEPSRVNNVEHNTRKVSPTYLLKDGSRGVEFNHDSNEALKIFNKQLQESVLNYTTRTGQKLQSKNYKWSAVVNIKEDTTMQDLEKLANRLNKDFGWQCYQIAIHRDEGYIDKETGEVKYNLHAHLEFLMLDTQGIYRFKKCDWGKKKMSQLQDIVAEELKMQRGETQQDRLKKIAALFNVDVESIQRAKNEKYYDFCQRLNKIAKEKGIKDFNAGTTLKGRGHLNHYDYKAMKRNEDALKEELKNERAQNEVFKQNVFSNYLKLQEVSAKNETLSKELLNIKDRLSQTELAFSSAPIKTQKELDSLKSQIRKEMIAEGGFTQEEYKELNNVVKSLKALFKDSKEQEQITVKFALDTIISAVNLTESNKKLKEEVSAKEQEIEDLKADLLTQKQQNALIQEERKKYIAEGNHIKEEYQKLLALKNTLFTKEQLNCALQKLHDEYEQRIAQKDNTIQDLNLKITELTAQLSEKPKTVTVEVQKRVEVPVIQEKIVTKTEFKTRELTDEEIENLPRVHDLIQSLANTEIRFEQIISQKDEQISIQQQKIKELNSAPVKTVEKVEPREYTNIEIENLPRVQNLIEENAILRNENTELNTQIEEYENGLRIVAQRIDDEGFPDIAEAIMSEDTIRSAFMRVADFISSTLKRGVQKVANSIGSVFHR